MSVTMDHLPSDGRLEHFLWALMFLKLYTGQKTLCLLAGGVDPETFHKWKWDFVEAVAQLDCLMASASPMHVASISCLMVVYSHLVAHFSLDANHFINDKGNDCLISVDGTDFQIPEHGQTLYSHKFKKSGLHCEVALCILTGSIVWINGPYECRLWPDISIFSNSLKTHLAPNERVEADDG